MRLVRGWTSACLVLVALLLVGAPSASAKGKYEFNDFQYQAYGPLKLNKLYGTTFETSNDRDWFKFKLRRRTQVTIPVLLYDFVGQCQAYVELINRSGRELGDKYLASYGDDRPRRQMKKTLRAGTYFLLFKRSTLFGESCVQGSFVFAVNR